MARRQLVPWLLVALVGAGAAAGVVAGALGGPGFSPAGWASQLVATTRTAGTAEVVVTRHGYDPGPLGTTRWAGVANFRTEDFAVEQGQLPPGSAVTVDTVGLGPTLYLAAYAGDRALGAPQQLSRPAVGPLAVDPSLVSLGPLGDPAGVSRVRREGAAAIDGVRTTRFVVTGQPLDPCGPATASQTARVWVDHAGRLVQEVLDQPDPFAGPATFTVTTVRFSHFGAKVHVAVPGPTAPVLAGAPPLPHRRAPIVVHGEDVTGGGISGGAFVAGCRGR